MTVSPADIVNRAVQFIGGYNDNTPITGDPPTFDGSAIGLAAGALYTGAVQTVGRQYGFDFSRNIAALTLTGNAAPGNWDYEYAYPTQGVQVRQLIPASVDLNNPMPVRWEVANDEVEGTPTKVILTNVENAIAVISNQPPETLWDAGFTETVVRLLAEELCLAIPGKTDSSKELLDESQAFEQVAEQRVD